MHINTTSLPHANNIVKYGIANLQFKWYKEKTVNFFGIIPYCCFVQYERNPIYVYNMDFPTSVVSLSRTDNACACPIPSWQLDPLVVNFALWRVTMGGKRHWTVIFPYDVDVPWQFGQTFLFFPSALHDYKTIENPNPRPKACGLSDGVWYWRDWACQLIKREWT